MILMRARLLSISILAALAAGPTALAQRTLEDKVRVRDFNQIVALAERCDYKLDDHKLQAYAEKVISAINPTTRALEINAADLVKRDYDQGSRSERLALCALYKGLSERYSLAP